MLIERSYTLTPISQYRVGYTRAVSSALLVLVAVLLLWVNCATAAPGIRSDNLELHPKFSLSGAYDSNFWRESTGDSTAPVNPSMLVLVDGGLSLKTRTTSRFDFKGDLSVGMRQVSSDTADDTASTIDDGFGLSRASAKFSLTALPQRTVSFGLVNDIRYSEQPATEDLVSDGYKRFKLRVGPNLTYSPGGGQTGKALSFEVGYRFAMARSLNEDDATGNRRDSDKQTIKGSVRWRFFPKTSLFVKSSYSKVDYARGTDLDASGVSVTGADLDSKPLTVSGGVKGLFTRRLSLTLQGGYIKSNHDSGESYEGPSAQFELDYRIPELLTIRAAYELSIGDDGYSNFYTLTRAFVDTRFMLPHHLYLKGRFGLDHYVYSGFGAPEWTFTLNERIEPIFRGKVSAGWRAQPWLRGELSMEIEANRSDYYYCLDPNDCFQGSPIDYAEFTRNLFKFTLVAEY